MNKFRFSKSNLKFHFEKNKKIYFMLFLCFLIGIIIGIMISFSKSSYLGLLNIKDKNMINFINGTISPLGIFWDNLSSFALSFILIFLLSLNYYLAYLNFVVVAYQSTLLFLTSLAMIESYSFLGFLKIFLLNLPINILYFCLLCFWIVVCFRRSEVAHKYKKFSAGYDYDFFLKLLVCFFALLILSFIIGIVLPLILKTAIFIIF